MKLYKAKAPMRIGFFGGGTDVSPYPEQYGGKVLNCTIDKYVRCMLKPNGGEGITIRSLDLSEVSRIMTGRDWDGKLSLPQAVMDAHPEINGFEITMFSDVPPGSGLGSSSALVVSMLKLLDSAFNLRLDAYEMAELAYRIERVDLGIPGGRQDQYAAVFGGMAVYHFGGEQVIVERIPTNDGALFELESCLIIGYVRDRQLLTHNLVQDQVRRVTEGETLRLHDETKAMVDEAAALLRRGHIKDFGKLLHHAWEVKKAFSPHIAPPIVNEIYDLALQNGAWGGKLSGAGGGGFMCFCVPFSKRLQLEAALNGAGVGVRPFSFTQHGVHAWSIEEED